MVGIALLGAGIFAKQAHVPALVKNDDANILAVYSRSNASVNSVVEAVNSATEAFTNIDVYSDEKSGYGLDELLQRSDIDAVIVLLPILIGPDVVRKCLAAGKHVLAEKPIAKDVATGKALIADYEGTYAQRNLVFSIAEQFRYDTAFKKAGEIVSSGQIGKLNHVHARVWNNVQPGGKYYETAWRKAPEYQGGFILDGGVHFVALVRMVAGQEIVETKSFAAQFQPHLPPVDTVNAAMKFSGGALGTLCISFASTKAMAEYIFVGTNGALTVKCVGPDTTLIVEGADRKVASQDTYKADGIAGEINAFVRAVVAGKGDKAGSPREALGDVAVVESICSGGGIVPSHTE
ncbi:hypothetical protein AJ79_05908 [Helicocarpus griseus UAMH5409]|uniref:Gfo/Idh/MocA-like oxidoreductase N-terminal domain-containing protein n=1 Tax=Helicocarpus griseus UAMH5409 TaxID=1447875 RepID=A0A2B7XJB1_9EURO|nr:hypothetical protein AJ79_05908 [Helicocarpus griseus UAMH5409]